MKKFFLLLFYFSYLFYFTYSLFAQDLYIKIENTSLNLPKLNVSFSAKNNTVSQNQINLFHKKLLKTLQWSGYFQIEINDQPSFLILKTKIEKNKLQVICKTNKNLDLFKLNFPFKPYHETAYAHIITKKLLTVLIHNTDILSSSISYITKNNHDHIYRLLVENPITNQTILPLNSFKITLLPRWQPQGRQILFSQISNKDNELYILSTKNWKDKKITLPKGVFSGADWGEKDNLFLTLSYHGNSSIYQFNLTTQETKKIIDDLSINTMPRYSPQTHSLLFVSNRSGNVQIYQKYILTNQVRRMTFQGHYNTDPAWSPSGKEFAYASRENGFFIIYIMSKNGQQIRQLTHIQNISAEQPTWSPDGQQIIYTGKKQGVQKLYAIYYNGTNNRRITSSPTYINEYNPSWIKKDLWNKPKK